MVIHLGLPLVLATGLAAYMTQGGGEARGKQVNMIAE